MGVTAPEYWEYQKRKAGAEGEQILGVVLLILGLLIGGWGFFQFRGPDIGAVIVGAILFFLGIGTLADANEKLKKIEHIYWTKQALREYEESKYKVLEGMKRESYPNTYGEPTLLDRLFGRVGPKPVGIREEPTPIEVEIIPEDDLTLQKERISNLLERLDERFVSGEVSEGLYKQLKSEYLTKLNEVEGEIKARERADFSKLRELLIAYADEKLGKTHLPIWKSIPEGEKLLYLVSETLKLPMDKRNVTNKNLLRCAKILNIEIPRKTVRNN